MAITMAAHASNGDGYVGRRRILKPGWALSGEETTQKWKPQQKEDVVFWLVTKLMVEEEEHKQKQKKKTLFPSSTDWHADKAVCCQRDNDPEPKHKATTLSFHKHLSDVTHRESPTSAK